MSHPSESPLRPSGNTLWPALVTLVTILATFGVNAWSNVAPIGGLNIGRLSNQLFGDVQVIPANYAFIIWGVIYVGLFSFAGYQVLPAQQQDRRLIPIRLWVIVSNVAQMAWVVVFLLRGFTASVGLMLIILGALIGVYEQIKQGNFGRSPRERWCVQWPFSVYLAWISVATIVNVAIALSAANWSGWGVSPELWSVGILGVGTAIAAWVLWQRSDRVYGLVLIWALVAVAIRQTQAPVVQWAASGYALLLIVLVIALLIFPKFLKKDSPQL